MMTNKDAIKILPLMKGAGSEWDTAIDIAMEALKAQSTDGDCITDEQAIEHLQSTGWMRNHDREMYESGLRKQLADDSRSYDALIPSEDTISRKAAIECLEHLSACDEPFVEIGTDDETFIGKYEAITEISDLPSAQSEQSTDIQDILQYLDNVIHPLVSPENWNVYSELHDMISNLPSAQFKINNQINLCDSCKYLYPACPGEKDDVFFGNGIGNDNICACNKYDPLRTKEDE